MSTMNLAFCNATTNYVYFSLQDAPDGHTVALTMHRDDVLRAGIDPRKGITLTVKEGTADAES